MHDVSKKLFVGAEVVGLVVGMGAWWRLVRVSAHKSCSTYWDSWHRVLCLMP